MISLLLWDELITNLKNTVLILFSMKKRVLLVVRDGWGYRKSGYKNAIRAANTPNADRLMKECPNTLLKASGEAVGLPEGYQGNSEVGHMTMGAGRVIEQSLTRINKAIKDGSFFRKKVFLDAINNCKKHNISLHIMGLLQVEGIHSHIDHLFALLDLCKRQKFHDVLIHAFTDGRDAPVHDGVKHMRDLQRRLKTLGFGRVVSVCGRYYAMDRDKRWDRTRKAYDAIVKGSSDISFTDPVRTMKQSYDDGVTDEFIVPRVRDGYDGMNKDDSIIFFNFRTDRPRQLTRAIVERGFKGWKRSALDVFFVAMTQYYSPMAARVAFEEVHVGDTLGEVVSRNGLSQLRVSETEKYAHVTFFFNDQVEKPYPGEDRVMVPSPKVATYDLRPEMSVYRITRKLTDELKKKKYDFVLTNLVNCDMVGHTGDWDAVIKAVEAVDDCVGKLVESAERNGYAVVILADHGNAEDMTKDWRTSHTTNPVPCIVVNHDCRLKKNMGLSNVAPAVLEILGLRRPKDMAESMLR